MNVMSDFSYEWFRQHLLKYCHLLTFRNDTIMLWGHILPYPKDGLVQPKHILWASSLGEDNFWFLTRHLSDRLQAENG